ncbi:MAG: thiamine-phosphate kinase [Lentisphaerae bacterium]|jgi:thiamine-monophosphate kinase|nr:thiamine-phosphate kinase [Lentisphaerota bacterium]MBT4821583.1 thiamine-phosphate kinase [Lentisphaerota bacterium]MBT5604432.1 thiamine-phosphate kinase [Lentisphaerota bacterium]MBT7058189.1 thiamine-phosphate kinase [Lentisphaerota bacterium]MBT7847427.1 thiamine-phosphate kinase [Lentisphaerota bacterium]
MTEDSFLQTLFARLPDPPGDVVVPPGDDCAALALPGSDTLLLVAVDQVIGGRHYLNRGDNAATPRQVGRKLLARNLSDIAAMGGIPTFCLTALGVAPEQDDAWLCGLFEGVLDLAHVHNVHLIGGDLACTCHDDVSSLTVLGTVPRSQVCLRSGAQCGDVLFATGAFGASFESGHHLIFEPRCGEGAWLAERGFARAMIDVSDGVLLDVQRMAVASAVGVELELASIPIRPPCAKVEQAVVGGEDYELLFAVAPDRADALMAEWPFADTPLARIGRFGPEAGTVKDANGGALGGPGRSGFDHFGMV